MKIFDFLFERALLALCRSYQFKSLLVALAFVLLLIGFVWFFVNGDTVVVSFVVGIIGLVAFYVRLRDLGNE